MLHLGGSKAGATITGCLSAGFGVPVTVSNGCREKVSTGQSAHGTASIYVSGCVAVGNRGGERILSYQSADSTASTYIPGCVAVGNDGGVDILSYQPAHSAASTNHSIGITVGNDGGLIFADQPAYVSIPDNIQHGQPYVFDLCSLSVSKQSNIISISSRNSQSSDSVAVSVITAGELRDGISYGQKPFRLSSIPVVPVLGIRCTDMGSLDVVFVPLAAVLAKPVEVVEGGYFVGGAELPSPAAGAVAVWAPAILVVSRIITREVMIVWNFIIF